MFMECLAPRLYTARRAKRSFQEQCDQTTGKMESHKAKEIERKIYADTNTLSALKFRYALLAV